MSCLGNDDVTITTQIGRSVSNRAGFSLNVGGQIFWRIKRLFDYKSFGRPNKCFIRNNVEIKGQLKFLRCINESYDLEDRDDSQKGKSKGDSVKIKGQLQFLRCISRKPAHV